MLCWIGPGLGWPKEGPFLNAGLGLGFITSSTKLSFLPTRRNKFEIPIDVRIGYGLSERLILHLAAESNWYQDAFGNLGSKTFYQNIYGVGGTYYLYDSSPSIFLIGTVGLGMLDILETAKTAEYGRGTSLGFGAEIVKHFNVHGSFTFLNTRKTLVPNLTSRTNTVVFRVLVSLNWY